MIDLQCNGAFGVDFLNADCEKLDDLSKTLGAKGLQAYAPTLISCGPSHLLDRVSLIGEWIRSRQKEKRALHAKNWAKPLGIHLEGPFLNPEAAGVHPKKYLRKATLVELERLWRASQETLRLITLAPEAQSPRLLKKIIRWADERSIRLSIGHSCASYEQAQQAFDWGFSAVTHAWNASPFHHRDPGVIGAALGRKDVYIQFIIDQVHVHPTVIRWALKLHPLSQIGFVSDCVATAGLKKGSYGTLGKLRIRSLGNQAALASSPNTIAGSGQTLMTAWKNWIKQEADFVGVSKDGLGKRYQKLVSHNPLRFLGVQ